MEIATGIMIAMIDMGPRPGSMPMNVPTRQPAMTIARFWIESAAERPIRMPSIISSPQKEGQRAQEDAEHLLHEVPDRTARDDRDEQHRDPAPLAENGAAAGEKDRGREQKAGGAKRERVDDHETEKQQCPAEVVLMEPPVIYVGSRGFRVSAGLLQPEEHDQTDDYPENRQDFREGRGPDRVALHEGRQKLVHREKRCIAVDTAERDEDQRDPAIERHGLPSHWIRFGWTPPARMRAMPKSFRLARNRACAAIRGTRECASGRRSPLPAPRGRPGTLRPGSRCSPSRCASGLLPRLRYRTLPRTCRCTAGEFLPAGPAGRRTRAS